MNSFIGLHVLQEEQLWPGHPGALDSALRVIPSICPPPPPPPPAGSPGRHPSLKFSIPGISSPSLISKLQPASSEARIGLYWEGRSKGRKQGPLEVPCPHGKGQANHSTAESFGTLERKGTRPFFRQPRAVSGLHPVACSLPPTPCIPAPGPPGCLSPCAPFSP